MKYFQVIVAMDSHYGIGAKGTLPWRLKGDMNYFRKVTTETRQKGKRNCVIMGRKTYFSIPDRFRPLKKRLNIVLSRNPNLRQEEGIPSEVKIADDFESALHIAMSDETVESIFVIGGSSVYDKALVHAACRRLHITYIDKKFPSCDTFFPCNYTTLFQPRKIVAERKNEGDISYMITLYERKK